MLKAHDLRGVYAIMPTPATADAEDVNAVNTVNLEESARLTDKLIRDGVSGIVILGTTGEAATLTPEEFKTFTECVLATASQRVPIFVGVTALGTHEIVTRIKFARGLKADGVMLGLPMWQPMTTEMAVKFYAGLSVAFPDTPIMAYANPRAFRHPFGDDLWEGIALNAPTVMSAKFSDPKALKSAIAASRGQINFLPHDARALEFYHEAPDTMTACWSTSSSNGPSPAIAVMEAILSGDMKRAEEIGHDLHWTSETVLPILRNPELFATYNIQLEKIRFMTGGYCNPGPVRPPYNVMPPDLEEAALECGRRWAKLVATKYPLKSTAV